MRRVGIPCLTLALMATTAPLAAQDATEVPLPPAGSTPPRETPPPPPPVRERTPPPAPAPIEDDDPPAPPVVIREAVPTPAPATPLPPPPGPEVLPLEPAQPYPQGFGDPVDPTGNAYAIPVRESETFPWGLLGLLGLAGLLGLRRGDRERTVYVERDEIEETTRRRPVGRTPDRY